jgi:hypothetical protein
MAEWIETDSDDEFLGHRCDLWKCREFYIEFLKSFALYMQVNR